MEPPLQPHDAKDASNPLGQIRIGCPVWACDRWKGKLFTRDAPRTEWLRQYSQVFHTVEGNSTFYALPPLQTVSRWAATTSAEFRFALKFPRSISHDKRLVRADQDTAAFIDRLRVLDEANRLGPAFLQLPPDFGPDSFPQLERYLLSLPTDLKWAVEVRHHDWFDSATTERQLDELLQHRGIDKVLFDSRPLYSKPPADESERISQTRKPRTPIRHTAAGRHPFLRIVGRNTVAETHRWIDEWIPWIRSWMDSGLSPYVFTHTPDDTFAPDFGRLFLDRLRQAEPGVHPQPEWPGEAESSNRKQPRLLF